MIEELYPNKAIFKNPVCAMLRESSLIKEAGEPNAGHES